MTARCDCCHEPLVSKIKWGFSDGQAHNDECDVPEHGYFVSTHCRCGEYRESAFFKTEQEVRFEWAYQMGVVL